MVLLRHLLSPWFGVLMGIAAALTVGAVDDFYDWNGCAPWHVVESWGLREEVPGQLVVPLGGDTATAIEIRRDYETGVMVIATVIRAGTGAVFGYAPVSEFGAPRVGYSGVSGGARVSWEDLNADGKWDERFDEARGFAEIRLGDRWLKRATCLDNVAGTDEGPFRFDATCGEWRPCIPAPAQGVDERCREP